MVFIKCLIKYEIIDVTIVLCVVGLNRMSYDVTRYIVLHTSVTSNTIRFIFQIGIIRSVEIHRFAGPFAFFEKQIRTFRERSERGGLAPVNYSQLSPIC